MWRDVFREDLRAHHPPLQEWRAHYRFLYPVITWQKRMRWLEQLESSPRISGVFRIVYLIVKYIHFRDSIRLGLWIPLHAFGPGLSIAHFGVITVESQAKIGANCRIHQGVTIGSSKGKSPTIGDNCFIGANATIVGGIEIGNNVKIGANALVNRSFPDGAVVAGVPAVEVHSR